jgi:hypothetical protein
MVQTSLNGQASQLIVTKLNSEINWQNRSYNMIRLKAIGLKLTNETFSLQFGTAENAVMLDSVVSTP